jgi:hypothetical protein
VHGCYQVLTHLGAAACFDGSCGHFGQVLVHYLYGVRSRGWHDAAGLLAEFKSVCAESRAVEWLLPEEWPCAVVGSKSMSTRVDPRSTWVFCGLVGFALPYSCGLPA